MNESTGFSSGSMEIARTASPLFLNSRYRLLSEGISALQDPHHVAQKLRITILPLNAESEIFLPWTSLSVKSGAAGPDTPAKMEPAIKLMIKTTKSMKRNGKHTCLTVGQRNSLIYVPNGQGRNC